MATSAWSTNPTLNTVVGGTNIAEGCSPAGINNAIRSVMAEARTKFDETDAVLATGTVAAAVGTRIYATKAALLADLTPADGLYALVTDDPTAANNGLYKKSGATGAGTWGGPSSLFSGAAAAYIAPQVAAAQAAAVQAGVYASDAEGAVASIAGYSRTALASAAAAGVSATSAANSVAGFSAVATAAEDTVSAIEQAAIDALAGLPISTTLPLQAVSRTALAAMTGMTSGRQAILSEAGRAGLFTFNTSNLSTQVTADPYQGLYVAPASATTGASGAWVRVVTDNEYHLSWWNPTQLGNNGHTLLNKVAALLPSGSTLLWGNNTVTVAANAIFLNPVHILGIGPSVSRLEVATGTPGSNFGQVGLLMIRDSHSSVRRIGFKNIETGFFANNPACVHVQKGSTSPTPSLAERLIEDVEISECTMENTSLGIVLAGSGDGNSATNNGVLVVASKNCRVHHNVITTNMHGIEIFGSDKALVHDNRILPSPNAAAAQFSAGIRLLGSEDYDVHDNRIVGLGYENSSRAAFRLSVANFGGGATRANRNGFIRNNTVTGTFTFCEIDESHGDLVIADNVWTESLTATVANYALLLEGSGSAIESLYVRSNTFKGVSNYIGGSSAGPVKHLQSRDNTVIGNAAVPTGSGRVYSANFASAKLAEFIRDTFLMANGGFDFKFSNAAGLTLRVVGCALPEAAGGTAMIDNDSTGTFIKTLGNTGEDATIGSNTRSPAGLRAAIV